MWGTRSVADASCLLGKGSEEPHPQKPHIPNAEFSSNALLGSARAIELLPLPLVAPLLVMLAPLSATLLLVMLALPLVALLLVVLAPLSALLQSMLAHLLSLRRASDPSQFRPPWRATCRAMWVLAFWGGWALVLALVLLVLMHFSQATCRGTLGFSAAQRPS